MARRTKIIGDDLTPEEKLQLAIELEKRAAYHRLEAYKHIRPAKRASAVWTLPFSRN